MTSSQIHSSSARNLRHDALRIWQAGVEAVRSQRLVRQHLRVEGKTSKSAARRSRSMRSGASPWSGPARRGPAWPKPWKHVLGPRLDGRKSSSSAGSTCRPIASVRSQRIHLHAARPAGVNEPTPEGVAGAAEILRLVGIARAGRSLLVPDLRRRLGPDAGAGRGHHPGRQAGRHPTPQRRRRQHRATQHASASSSAESRAAGCCGRAARGDWSRWSSPTCSATRWM